MTTDTKTQSATTSPSTLYYEMRGSGAPVLLIPGTPGDGGQFEALADVMARDRLVITYDRVGTSRSPAPSGWSTTNVAEQADDAVRLLRSLTTEPATVFGTSNGALIALELALRHPTVVAKAVLHEAPLLSVLSDPEPVGSMLGELIGTAMAVGGPPAALQAFLRFAYGDTIVDSWSDDLRGRFLANAEMVFGVELPAFQAYRPDEGALASPHAPLLVVVGAEQRSPFFLEAAAWLSSHSSSPLIRTPGAHGPKFSCPEALASMLFRD